MNINELTPKHANMEELMNKVPEFNGTFSEFVDMLMNHEVTLMTDNGGEIVDFWVHASDDPMLDNLIGQKFATSYIYAYSSETLMKWLGMVIKAKQANLKIEDIDEDYGTCKIGGVDTHFKDVNDENDEDSYDLDDEDEDYEMDYDEAVEYLEEHGINMDPCCSEEGEYACDLLDDLDEYNEDTLAGLISDIMQWRDEQKEEEDEEEEDDDSTLIITYKEYKDFDPNAHVRDEKRIKDCIRWKTKHCIKRGNRPIINWNSDKQVIEVRELELGRALSAKELEDIQG